MPWYIGVAGCLGVIVGSVAGWALVAGIYWLVERRQERRGR